MSQFVITPYLQQTETQARQILPQSVSSTFPLCSMQVPLSPFQPIISFCKSKSCSVKNDLDSVVVGIVRNVYNWLYHGIVGNSVCRTWESCTLAFPCAVNRVIHDSIASYAHFHNACLLVFIKMSILVIKKSPAYYHIQSHSNLFTLYIERFLSAKFILQMIPAFLQNSLFSR